MCIAFGGGSKIQQRSGRTFFRLKTSNKGKGTLISNKLGENN